MGLKTIIDPDGDLQISVTWGSEVVSEAESEEGGLCPETLELRVSSHVLMLASPVFKVMFTGRFKEAVGLTKKRAVSKPYELDLPEDDAEAVQILFFVLHFNFAQVPERPSISCLEKLAVLCDKYQCTNAIKYCGKVWLQAWIHEVSASTAVEDICRLIVFAYVADFPQEFTAATWLLCLHHKGPIASGDTQVRLILAHPLLHPDLANYIDAKRMEMLRGIPYRPHGPCEQDLGNNARKLLFSSRKSGCRIFQVAPLCRYTAVRPGILPTYVQHAPLPRTVTRICITVSIPVQP